MATTATESQTSGLPKDWTLADLQRHLGDVPADRVLLHPLPGLATEDDVNGLESHGDRLCELVDGVLVEKAVGSYESILAGFILTRLNQYLEGQNLGQVLGADGILKILPGKVRIPDVCFLSWRRFSREKLSRRPMPEIVPDLVVEVLSESNTKPEMEKKLNEYFDAGVRLVWYIDPNSRTATSYTSPNNSTVIPEDGSLEGADLLPGFRLPLKDLFDWADRHGPV